jgi:hypothetical protein
MSINPQGKHTPISVEGLFAMALQRGAQKIAQSTRAMLMHLVTVTKAGRCMLTL